MMVILTIVSHILLLIVSFGFDNTNGMQKAYYGLKAPYKLPSSTLVLPSAPSGFQLVCSQGLFRHGSRAPANPQYHALPMVLWEQAKKEDALTELGKRFGADFRAFITISNKLGPGELSGLGKLEQHSIAHRLARRLSVLFRRSRSSHSRNHIQVVINSNNRVKQSLHAFISGLPSNSVSSIDFQPANDSLLHFFDSKHERYLANNAQLNDKIQSIQMQPYSRQIARKFLERLFTAGFVDKLASGHYAIMDHNSALSIKNEIDAVLIIHSVYETGPELREEGDGTLLEKYFHPMESAWFAYLSDAYDYYMKGPSFTNQTATYDIAQVLLDDFFSDSEQCSRGHSTHFLRARFTDDNEFAPFTALLKIPDLTDKQTPANETYTYKNNEWRDYVITPMTANIQWDIYRHHSYSETSSHRQEQVLIRMLLNEHPIPFQRNCEQYDTEDPFFYTLDELKRCYNIDDG